MESADLEGVNHVTGDNTPDFDAWFREDGDRGLPYSFFHKVRSRTNERNPVRHARVTPHSTLSSRRQA